MPSIIQFHQQITAKAATAANCQQLLSEDLKHSQNLDGVVVANPFKPEGVQR